VKKYVTIDCEKENIVTPAGVFAGVWELLVVSREELRP
jgi:hypothetical protein